MVLTSPFLATIAALAGFGFFGANRQTNSVEWDELIKDRQCPGHECYVSNHMKDTLDSMTQFRFDVLTAHLPDVCPANTSRSCQESTCYTEEDKQGYRYVINSLRWLCNRQARFQSTIGCWNLQFTVQMNVCIESERRHHGPHAIYINHRNCFMRVLNELPSCSEDAKDLFTSLWYYATQHAFDDYA